MSVSPPARQPDTEPPPTPEPASAASRRRSGWAALRPLVMRLHFYAGLLIAPFLLIAALTGGLYAASYQIEKVLYADELTAPVGDRVLPLSEQIAAAGDAFPEGELTAVRPSDEPGSTTRVLLADPSVDEDRQLAVFVDPYTAEVRGDLESYGSSGALPFRAWVSELHRMLHLGETGRLYSELAASWLWVVALGGVLLWLARRRSQRRLRGTTGRRRTRSLHGHVGLWSVLGLLMLSATGLTWSTYAGANIAELREKAGGSTPVISTAPGGGHEDHAGHGSHGGHEGSGSAEDGGEHPILAVDRIVEVARDEHRLSGPLEIVPPAIGEDGVPSAYVVTEIDKQVPYHRDKVALDASSGELTDRVDFSDYPVLAKLSTLGIDLHMGQLFGLPNELLLVLLAVAVVVLILYGYRMWWLRRPTGGGRLSFGRPYPRGTLRQVPVSWWLPLVGVTALVGWFMPLFGLGLLVFLAVDVAVGLYARMRAAAEEPAEPEVPDGAEPDAPEQEGDDAAAPAGRTS